MSVTATSILALPVENARTLFANSTSFQSWTDSADADAAKEHIYVRGFEAKTKAELEAMRPFIVLHAGNDWQMGTIGDGASNCFQVGGSVVVLFEADVPAAYSAAAKHRDAETDFLNQVGEVFSDIRLLAGSDNYLSVNHIHMLDGPYRSDPAIDHDEGDYYGILFVLAWGGLQRSYLHR